MANQHISPGTWFRLTVLAAALAAGAPSIVLAQAPAAATSAAAVAPIPPEEMEKLVGPIALYPDDLVSVILPASTNPLQIVQADRWLDARKANPKLPIEDKWDDPVKTLANYPDVVKKMSKDLDWTAALGEAVVADTGAVLEGVQAFRRRAQAAGNLKTDSKQTVVIEQEVVKITPANPEVIYVPQYEPTAVVVSGYSAWGYWPTAYPSYYYPYAPGAALATGLIWGAAIGAAWGGRYVSHYGGNANINVNRNTNINTGNIGSGNRGGGNTATQWKSNKSPGQVSSSVGSNRSSGGRAGDSSFGGGNRGGGAGGASAGTRPSQGGGGNAFGGYDSGRQTQMDSSRGASSRSSSGMSDRGGGGGSRASSGGGGSRSMGGGSRGGGGGGRRR